jgi:hypothetical protein
MRPRPELEPHRNQLQPLRRGAAPPARGANSSSVELTNTRTRWSGVRIGTSIRFPQRPDAYDRRLGQSRPSTPYTGGRGLIEIQFGNIWYQRPPHCVSVFPGGLANRAAALQQRAHSGTYAAAVWVASSARVPCGSSMCHCLAEHRSWLTYPPGARRSAVPPMALLPAATVESHRGLDRECAGHRWPRRVVAQGGGGLAPGECSYPRWAS